MSAAHDIRAFAQFTVDAWTSRDREIVERDLTIMTLGLPGECAEVMEVLVDFEGRRSLDPAVRSELCKELGDTVYYWARIAKAFSLDVAELAAGLLAPEPLRQKLDGAHHVADHTRLMRAGLEMVVGCGRVAEVAKKRVRDDNLDVALLRRSMSKVILHWGELCDLCGLDWREVLETNKVKLLARRAKTNAAAAAPRLTLAA